MCRAGESDFNPEQGQALKISDPDPNFYGINLGKEKKN